ncbi:MAG: hypothetical protein HQK51_13460 [Oligoflexia bacterium]|nr:hypothetical protein [Oligoflexia bacterium]
MKIFYFLLSLLTLSNLAMSFAADDPCTGDSATVKSCLKSIRDRVISLEREVANFKEAQRYGFIVFNSVANGAAVSDISSDANTHNFWKILYNDRFKMKGNCMLGPSANLNSNCYNPQLYKLGPAIYTDVVEDVNGKIVVMFSASADGIDETTMKLTNSQFLSGDSALYVSQFASGWSSVDTATSYDNDPWDRNCAVEYGATQYYSACWLYNIGSDAGSYEGSSNNSDSNWGPHLHGPTLDNLGLARGSDTSKYVRVKRITRYVLPKK